ncbi:MAG TPA: hypothetical protein VI895_04515 [Bdellovibrionota bacterium]|nr:hypothetical protein [Bdellovibrionota bacterium]
MEMVAAKLGEKESKSSRETVLRDFVRLSWRATRGLTTVAEAEGRDLVRKMTELGRVTPEEGDRLLGTLLSRMQRSQVIFEQRVDSSVRKAMDRLNELSTRELGRMGDQASRLERRLEGLAQKKRAK